MRKSRFTELQILAILGEGEAGLPVAEVLPWASEAAEDRSAARTMAPSSHFTPRRVAARISRGVVAGAPDARPTPGAAVRPRHPRHAHARPGRRHAGQTHPRRRSWGPVGMVSCLSASASGRATAARRRLDIREVLTVRARRALVGAPGLCRHRPPVGRRRPRLGASRVSCAFLVYVLPPLPWRSDWRYCRSFVQSYQPSPKG